ncbi:LamG domain-containing protein [Nitratiruptor sp. YY09-18]|uniref:LamG domain-containing protein n=1 Tax=Nitratiruptor sp. YY09-18 TaxID=2724901 RepID=UPI0019151A07|nr:LamG domain-containing protein [Nitratiruptor sp. YY09-18]BCD68680.1 MSHA biogenesis protein MshQ [Nitratiruptor sp. YY09-18]
MRLIFLLISFVSILDATTLVVDDDNSCNGAQYSTIEDAVKHAQDGDTIKICPGTYIINSAKGIIKINKNNLTLISSTKNPNDVRIKSDKFKLIEIGKDRHDITVAYLTLRHSNSDDVAAIHAIDKCKNIALRNLDIQSEGFGIVFNKETSGIKIENMKIFSDDPAIKFNDKAIDIQIKQADITVKSNKGIVFAKPEEDIQIFDINLDVADTGIYLAGDSANKAKFTIKNVAVKLHGDNSAAITWKKDKEIGSLYVENLSIDAADRGVGIWSKGKIKGDFSLLGSQIRNCKHEAVYIKEIEGEVKIVDNIIDKAINWGIYFEKLKKKGEIKRNIIKNVNHKAWNVGIQLLKQDEEKDLGFQIDHNCFYNNAIHFKNYDTKAKFDDGKEGNYWDDWSGKGSYTIDKYGVDHHPLKSCPLVPKPVGDWHFDECELSGNEREIEDYSSLQNNGTPLNGANTSKGKVCRALELDGMDDYVEIKNKNEYDDTKKLTIMAWIYPTQLRQDNKNNARGVISKRKNYNSENAYGVFFWNDQGMKDNDGDGEADEAKLYIDIDGSNNRFATNRYILKNHWTHVAIVFDGTQPKEKRVKVYINGELDKTAAESSDYLKHFDSNLYIGNLYSGNTYKVFKGEIDEVKIWKGALNDDEIKNIFDNEKEGKNYDGSERNCIKCGCQISSNVTITPLEFEGGHMTIQDTTTNPHWTHVDFNKSFSSVPVVFVVAEKNGSHPAAPRIKNVTKAGFDIIMAEPQGEDGPHYAQNVSYLAVNKGIHKIGNTYIQVGTITTKKYQQHSSGKNYLDVDEWEKVDTIFSGCKPVVVGTIQTLNNEIGLDRYRQGTIIRSIPFLTTAIDVNSSGIYLSLERSETHESSYKKDGEIVKEETIGYMLAPPNIQDSIVDDYNNTVLFETMRIENYFVGWDDSCKVVNFVNHYNTTPLIAANKNSKNGIDGGWLRRCVLNSSQVGFRIDEDGSGYSKKSYYFKSSYQDTERHHIPETGGIFVFSRNFVIREEQNQIKAYKFDAWDTFRDFNDRNISTKIVNQPFSLTIASLNEQGESLQEFNGTVCAQIVDANNMEQNYTSWQKIKFIEANSSQWQNIIVARAVKEAKVKIAWKKGVNESCPLNSEDNQTLSTDNFAIRPERFTIELNETAPIRADEEFQITFKAVEFNAISAVKDYNETKNSSFIVEANETKPGCIFGDLDLEDFNFSNGLAQTNATYNEVGEINITIREKDICTQKFAYVDCKDKNISNIWNSDKNLTIQKALLTHRFIPHHFEINATSKDHNGIFTYYSNDLHMSALLEGNITAKNAENETTENYNALCYAHDLGITFEHTPLAGVKEFIYILQDAKEQNQSRGSIDANASLQLSYDKSNFTQDNNGSTRFALWFNFDKNYSKPVNPQEVTITKIHVGDGDANGLQEDVESALHFRYGRIITQDLLTHKSEDNTTSYIIYYDDTNSSAEQIVPKWRKNIDHSIVTDGKIKHIYPKANFSMQSGNLVLNTSTTFHQALYTIKVQNTNSIKDAMLHIDIPSWLWFSYSDENYSIDATSTCAQHPCIEYHYRPPIAKTVKSGETNGTQFDQGVAKSERGVKVFR